MAKTTKKKPSKWTVWWNHFFEKYFYIPPIISAISALWFPLVVVWLGKYINVVDKNKDFTTFGIIISILIFAVPASLTIIKTFVERYKEVNNIN